MNHKWLIHWTCKVWDKEAKGHRLVRIDDTSGVRETRSLREVLILVAHDYPEISLGEIVGFEVELLE